MTSGGYSNSGARGKTFQKLMFSRKKKGFDFVFHFFFSQKHGDLYKKEKVFTLNLSCISHFSSQLHINL